MASNYQSLLIRIFITQILGLIARWNLFFEKCSKQLPVTRISLSRRLCQLYFTSSSSAYIIETIAGAYVPFSLIHTAAAYDDCQHFSRNAECMTYRTSLETPFWRQLHHGSVWRFATIVRPRIACIKRYFCKKGSTKEERGTFDHFVRRSYLERTQHQSRSYMNTTIAWVETIEDISAGNAIWIELCDCYPPFGLHPALLLLKHETRQIDRTIQHEFEDDFVFVSVLLPAHPGHFPPPQESDSNNPAWIRGKVAADGISGRILCDFKRWFLLEFWSYNFDFIRNSNQPRIFQFSVNDLYISSVVSPRSSILLQWHMIRRNLFKNLLKHILQKHHVITCFGKAYSSDNAGDGPLTTSNTTFLENTVGNSSAGDNLVIAAWNCNGHLISSDMQTVANQIIQNKIDISLLSDTRLSERMSKAKQKQLRKLIFGYSILLFPSSRSSYTHKGGQRMNTMGGSIIIVSPRCAMQIVSSTTDPSGLAIAANTSLIINGKKYCFISFYQPIGNDNSGKSTVYMRLKNFLTQNNISDTPLQFIPNVVSRWILKARKSGYTPIVAGDFNADPTIPSGNKLLQWANENNLANGLTHALPSKHYTHLVAGVPVSSIDHIYLDPGLVSEIASGKVLSSPDINLESDHNIICISLYWNNTIITDPSPIESRSTRRIELPHYNAAIMNEYSTNMQNWFENEYPTIENTTPDMLLKIMQQSVSTVQEMQTKSSNLREKIGLRSSFKDGYSPCYMAILDAYRETIKYHRRLLNCPAGRSMRRQQLHNQYTQAIHEWQGKYPITLFTEDPYLLRVIKETQETLANIRLLSNISLKELYCRALNLRRLMHGRKRSEMRKRSNAFMESIENYRQQNRIGRIFSLVNLKEKQALDLSYLNVEGNVITNPEHIHNCITDHFRQWYATPDNLHAIAKNFLEGNFWQSLLSNFNEDNPEQLPSDFKWSAFKAACASKVNHDQADNIANEVLAPISWKEYADEISCMKYGKAPGPTGITATMIKAWPEDIHKLVLQLLNDIWQSKEAPHWWHKGHLRPIPKPGEQSLENLRPLGLYEISRKILTAIIIKRTLRKWEEFDLLNSNQYAFRKGRSTSQAILRILNANEDASERDLPIWQLLWDLRRAFDSIPFNFSRLALARLGVPSAAVEFLVMLMENNSMTVTSPFHMANHNANPNFACIDASFHQERGTGQGDPPSPIIWIAVFDILLDMLQATSDSGAYYAHSSISRIYKADDTAYADDLLTISSTYQLQQEKADLVCTFCACTGMQVAHTKVRAFALNQSSHPSAIILHDSQWSPIPIFSDNDAFDAKYLGFPANHENNDLPAFEAMEMYLQKVTAVLIHCRLPKYIKLLIYRMQITPKVLYVATKACWPLSQYKKLDKYPNQLLKHIGGHMPSSPNAILYFPTDQCGSGLHPISDLAQSQKWGELTRCLDSSNASAHAASGILERTLRQTAQQSMSIETRQIFPRNMKYLKSYAGSLIEWGSNTSVALTHSPEYNFYSSNAAILPHLEDGKETDRIIKLLQRRDIVVQGELTRMSHNGETRWETDKSTQDILHALEDHVISPSDEHLILNTGQIYQLDNQILEIIGILETGDGLIIQCYEWFQSDIPKNTIIRIKNHNLAIVMVEYNLFISSVQKRISTVPSATSKFPNRYCTRRIIATSECSPPSAGEHCNYVITGPVSDFASSIQELMSQHQCKYSIFTDGSFQPTNLQQNSILMSTSHIATCGLASAALIAIADAPNWNELPIAALILPSDGSPHPGLNAYTAELIALTTAVHVQQSLPDVTIYTDCQSAQTTVFKACSSTSNRSSFCFVRTIVNSLKGLDPPKIIWQRSHPERHNSNNQNWSRNDWGIYLADLAARHEYDEMLLHHQDIIYTELFLPSLLQQLIPPGTWYWAGLNSSIPRLTSPIKEQSTQRVLHYLENRDAERTKRILKLRFNDATDILSLSEEEQDAFWLECNKWSGTSLGLANQCWRVTNKGLLSSNQILKNVLDKYWHGRNRAKGNNPNDPTALCRICQQPDSQVHILLECHHEELNDIRANAMDQVIAIADEILTNSSPCLHARNIIEFFLSHFMDADYPNIDRLWLGTWNNILLHAAISNGTKSYNFHMTNEVAKSLQNVIIQLTQPLITAVKMLMCQCREILKEHEKDIAHENILRNAPSYPQTVAKTAFTSTSKKNVHVHITPSIKRKKNIEKRRGLSELQMTASWIHQDDDTTNIASPLGVSEFRVYDCD